MATLVFALAALGVGATPALAGDPTNVAGRPFNGIGFGSGSSCHGTIYGRVNGVMVLFYAHHCKPIGGTAVPGANGTTIGYTAHDFTQMSDQDMGYIILTASSIPSDPNKVYFGPSSWQNDKKIPSANVTCGDFNYGPKDVKTGYRSTFSTGHGPYQETIVSVDQSGIGCLIDTGLDRDSGPYNIPSGAPFKDDIYQEFIGVATDAGGIGGAIRMNHWRGAIKDLQDYYGADDTFFCANDACN
jgi:hypothetical protein